MIDREKTIRQGSLNFRLPVRTILCVLICYVILHHVVYFHFDGRSLTDHSYPFTEHYGRIIEGEKELGLALPVANLFKYSMYPLVNALLAIASYVYGVSLTLYRFFNLPFYILLHTCPKQVLL